MRSRTSYISWFIVLFLAVVCFFPTAVLSSIKGIEVPCQVQHNIISMTVTDGNVAYGVLALGATKDTLSLADNQTATNTGNVTVKFQIKSSNAIGGTDWTLGAAAGANIFTHKASIDGGSTWNIAMTVADTYVDLAASVAPQGTQVFDLQIGMPTSVTDYYQHNITVTILAVTP